MRGRPAVAALVMAVAACGSDEGSNVDPDEASPSEAIPGSPSEGTAGGGYVWQLPAGFPRPVVPSDNPMSESKVELGRALFYDKRLSVNGSVSCASCHRPETAFSDARAQSVGATGERHPRSAPSLANAGYHARLGWASPNTRTLEEQARTPLFGENAPIVEMGLISDAERAEALLRILADERYRALFATAFPGVAAPGFPEVIFAIASFERTLVSGSSPADLFNRTGDLGALTPAARRGRVIFNEHVSGSVCHHCHGGLTLSNEIKHEDFPFDEISYTNVGLYNIGGRGDYPPRNQGLFEKTGDPGDRGKFRTPTLRNIAVTGPYMHDGSVGSLREVVAVYQAGGRSVLSGSWAGDGRSHPNKDRGLGGMSLEGAEIDDLLAYLEAFTDRVFLDEPRFRNPYPEDSDFGP